MSTLLDPSSSTSLISYPALDDTVKINVANTSKAFHVVPERLFIGNLHPTVDEYTLLKIFSKYGNVTKLDFLFHKAGLLKGKPRGYAFIEFQNKDDATRAMSALHGKPFRGRNLVVTRASQSAILDYSGAPLNNGGVHRTLKKPVNESGKPTMLSMIKSGVGNPSGAGSSSTSGKRRDTTKDQIARLEAKLQSMNESSAPTSTLTSHPSLPAKPPSLSSSQPSGHKSTRNPSNFPSSSTFRKPPLPLSPLPTMTLNDPLDTVPTTRKPRMPALTGVKLKKPSPINQASSTSPTAGATSPATDSSDSPVPN